MEILENGFAWVCFRFSDGSSQWVYTTASAKILLDRGIQLKAGCLFDLLHGEYIAVREDAVEVRVFEERPAMKGGLQEFASRFI